jgi:hypothetical protein
VPGTVGELSAVNIVGILEGGVGVSMYSDSEQFKMIPQPFGFGAIKNDATEEALLKMQVFSHGGAAAPPYHY